MVSPASSLSEDLVASILGGKTLLFCLWLTFPLLVLISASSRALPQNGFYSSWSGTAQNCGSFLIIVLAIQWVLLTRKLCPSVLGYFLPLFSGNFPLSFFSLLEIPVKNWTMAYLSSLVLWGFFPFFCFAFFVLSRKFL